MVSLPKVLNPDPDDVQGPSGPIELVWAGWDRTDNLDTQTYLYSQSCGIILPGSTLADFGFGNGELYCVLGIADENPISFTYDWSFSGSQAGLSALDIPNPVALGPGTYQVTVTESSCGVVHTDEFILDPCFTSIVSVEDQAFEVFPNPSSGRFFIENQGHQRSATFRVADLNGRIIHEANGAASNSEVFSLRLGDVPSGMYVLMIQYDGNVEVHRLIVQ